MNKWPRQSGSLTPMVLQSLGCQGLAVPGACCSHHAFEHWSNVAGTNPPPPSSKQGVQVQAPLLQRHLLCCQVWTSHSPSAAEACISSIEPPSSPAWNTNVAPMFLFFNKWHQHSPKWCHISCHSALLPNLQMLLWCLLTMAAFPTRVAMEQPGCPLSPGAVSVLAHGMCPVLALSCVQRLVGVGLLFCSKMMLGLC